MDFIAQGRYNGSPEGLNKSGKEVKEKQTVIVFT
jgi:hypothetical protein